MDANDVFKAVFGLEAQGEGSFGIKISGPAGNDFDDGFVGLKADEIDGIIAGDLAERLDLLGYRAGKTRQGERASIAQLLLCAARQLG